jgi:integrase
MARLAKPLGALQVKNLSKTGYHPVGTVPGLYLQVSGAGAKSWILRIVVGQKRREMGLGGYPAVPLADAHEAARRARDLVRGGVDPVQAKKEARSRLIAEQASSRTFKACAEGYMAAHEDGWKNPKHAQQWRNTLETYAYPVIGQMLVRDVELPDVMQVLEPIWKQKTETAKRLRGRIEAVLDWATTRGYRTGLNPARWKGHLDKLLASPKKISRVKHHEAVAPKDVGAFMQELRTRQGAGPKALEFLILTAVRSANVRKATWSEIDLENRVWSIPGTTVEGGAGQRMKSGRALRVPLSKAATSLLKALPRVAETELIFAGSQLKPLSDMTLSAVLRRMKVPAVPHGFRATFKTWATEQTRHSRELIEVALAHAVGDKVEEAYMRGDMFDKRRRLMDDWAAFLSKGEERGQVVPIGVVTA